VAFAPAAAGLRLLLVDTRARHELTGGEYASRRAECEEAARQLGVPSLRYATDARGALDRLGPVLRRRARHVISDNRRVHAVADLLRTGDIGAIGPLLTASHASLRDDFEVSWPEADVAVEAAASGGAVGARMIGGGFGGSVLALLPAASDSEVQAAIRAAYAGRGWQEPGFLAAVPSAPARRLS
jgi:galactokinase